MLTQEQQAIQLLELLAGHYGVRVDRGELSRWASAANLTSDDDVVSRLVVIGNRVGLRIAFYDCDSTDLAAFAKQRQALLIPPRSEGESPWLAVVGSTWTKFKVSVCGRAMSSRKMSRRKLRRQIGMTGAMDRVRCLVAQPLSAGFDRREGPISPSSRLFQLFRPDRRDIWAMAIFSVVVGVLTLAAPLAVESLVNTVAFGRFLKPIIVLSLLLMVFLAFAAALRALLAVVAEVLQRRLFVRVSEDLAYRLPRVEAAALDGKYGPELVNRFLDVASVQKASAFLLLDGLTLIISAVIGMAVLGFYHPFLLGFDLVLLALMAFTIFVLGRGAVGTAQKESKAKFYLTSWLEDIVRNPTAFAMHGGSRFAMERTDKLAVGYLDYRRKHFRSADATGDFSLRCRRWLLPCC